MTHNKIIRLLAITGALLTATARAQTAEKINPGLGVFTATEQDTTPKNYIGINIQPNLTWEADNCKVGYYGSFYCEKNDPGTDSDWATLGSKIQAESEGWTLEIGRGNTQKYAGHLYTPTTSSFDNLGAGKGTTRNYTGAILTHKGTGLSLGQVASNGNLSHLDQTLLGWTKELTEQWAIQLQAAADQNGLSKTGASLKWQADDATALVAEGFYKDHETTALLTANRRLTDNLTLFGGAQMTWADEKETGGLLTAGASYKLGNNITLVTAAQQKIGDDAETTALAGIKFNGNLR